jgi:hypothetical protein
MTSDIEAALQRIEGVASGVASRSVRWGLGSIIVGAAAWAVPLRERFTDPFERVAPWLPLLLVLLIPGVLLLGFAGRLRKVGGLRARLAEDVAEVRADVREDLTPEQGGLQGLRSLIGGLRGLREHAGSVGDAVRSAMGTVRLLNPIYLGMVLLAALAAGLVVIGGIVAVVVVLI